MSASNKPYKIRCKNKYIGFTPGCEYLGHIGYGHFGNLGMITIDDDGDSRMLDLDTDDDFEYIPPVTSRAVDEFLAEQEDDEEDD